MSKKMYINVITAKVFFNINLDLDFILDIQIVQNMYLTQALNGQ